MSEFFEGLAEADDVTGWLRRYIVGRLHVGTLTEGVGLPSIRRLAELSQVDHRRIADAYRVLAEEGLVEIRAGSGVSVARVTGGTVVAAERERWMADLLFEGWMRRMTPAEVGRQVKAATRGGLRCACVESTRDHMVALGAELEEDFGLEVGALDVEEVDASALEGKYDFVVGTSFVSERAERLARQADLPFVMVRVNPELAREMVTRMEKHRLVAVVSDPRFEARVRDYLAPGPLARRVTVVSSSEVERLEDVPVPADGEMVATRAARRDLGAEDFHLLPSVRFIAPSSARAIFESMMAIRGRGERQPT